MFLQHDPQMAQKITKFGQYCLKKIILVFGKQKPRYKHDCKNCKFLGRHHEYDLYFCAQDFSDTVVARYSDNGPDYLSGKNLKLTPLLEAERRAIKMGLLKK